MDFYPKRSNKVAFANHSGSSGSTTYAKQYPGSRRGYNMEEEEEEEVQISDPAASSSSAARSPRYTSEASSSRYFSYPATKPFIDTDFTRADRPVSAYPTSDRDAVVTALKNLQEKMKNFEIERSATEQNLQPLASDTEQHTEMLNGGKRSGRAAWAYRHHGQTDQEEEEDFVDSEARGRLSAAEHRSKLLEEQLENMQQMIRNSERGRQELMEKAMKAHREKEMAGADIKLHMDRLNELERDQLRMTATQSLAERLEGGRSESKIRELEQRVREEKMHRQMLQERTAQLESARGNKKMSPPSQPVPVTSFPQRASKAPPPQVLKSKKPPKKKKKTVQAKHPPSTCRSEPRRHYRLNLAEIPFVAGKSTGPSHSLGANVQKVLAMMKSHNPTLCSLAYTNGDMERSDSTSSDSLSNGGYQDLADLLAQLQDEFGELSSEHQDIMSQMYLARESQVKEELEQELELLLAKMEAKSQQISKMRQHQQRMEKSKKVKFISKESEKSKQPPSISRKVVTANNQQHHHHHHHHLKRSNNNLNYGLSRPKPQTCTKSNGDSLGKPALFMLRDMKKLQTTLRKDDLSWV